MLTRLRRWWRGRQPHDWTPWETREEPAAGFAAAFSGATTVRSQSRFCKRCGFSQDCGVNVYVDVDCEQAR